MTFKFNCKTQFGQRLWLVGDHPQLGGWDCSKWVKMRWAQGDVWTADVAFEHLEGKATPVAFKVSSICPLPAVLQAVFLRAIGKSRCRCAEDVVD